MGETPTVRVIFLYTLFVCLIIVSPNTLVLSRSTIFCSQNLYILCMHRKWRFLTVAVHIQLSLLALSQNTWSMLKTFVFRACTGNKAFWQFGFDHMLIFKIFPAGYIHSICEETNVQIKNPQSSNQEGKILKEQILRTIV